MRTLKINTFLKFIGFILLIVIILTIDIEQAFVVLKHFNYYYILLSFVAMFTMFLLKSIRWNILLKLSHINYSLLNSLIVFMSSNFIAFITPGRVGEIAKGFYIKTDNNEPLAKTLPSVIVDRLFDIYLLLIFGFIGFAKFTYAGVSNLSIIIVLLILAILPIIILNKKIMYPIIKCVSKLKWINRYNKDVMFISDIFFKEIKQLLNYRLLYGLLLTFLSYLILFYLGFLVSCSLRLEIDFITIAIFISIANILSYIPISISGIGTREASLITLFYMIGKSKEEAIVFSTILFFILYIIGGIYGFIAYSIKPIDIKAIGSKNKTGMYC